MDQFQNVPGPSQEAFDTLSSSVTTLNNGTAKIATVDLSASGSEMSLPGVSGIVIFHVPRTVTTAWTYALLYVKQNSNVNVKWLTEEPTVLTVTAGENKITVTNTATYGIFARAIMVM